MNNDYSYEPKLNLYEKENKKTGQKYWAYCVEMPDGKKIFGYVPKYYEIKRIKKEESCK